jgi:hypothetical protein
MGGMGSATNALPVSSYFCERWQGVTLTVTVDVLPPAVVTDRCVFAGPRWSTPDAERYSGTTW